MNDIQYLLTLTYQQCCDFLRNKYGEINGNYFVKENCKTKNQKITRGNEGLHIHHIDEDKAIMLSNRHFAILNPFEYQKGERLIYCNLLEHLVLHIKIIEHPHPNKNSLETVGWGGLFNFMIPELNDMYSGFNGYKESSIKQYKIKLRETIIDYKKEYFMCLKYLMKIDKTYFIFYLKSFHKICNRDYDDNINKRIYKRIYFLWKEVNSGNLISKFGYKFIGFWYS
ncbi:hypothetical protein BCF59_0272 [Mycoplasmopsis mustelae]|uniref:Uncharacterized protein n=1 Tax=Mycoplasmopsis mustelae TaxID=171289 RepID=A0A4R7UEL3_9BACT|nr:hypothetical protein [Mycoplasmopsis mustelae]TDV24313.1 hypothetical protein BCF59_0272 [Mycoplasmopsis mustelae]